MIKNKKPFFYKLKDFCTVGDGAHASIARREIGVMYLTSKNFKNTGLDLSKVDYISEIDYEKYFEKNKTALIKPCVGDIVFGIIGTIGTPYIVRKDDRFGLSSSVGIIRPNNDINSTYLYYFMTSSVFQSSVEAIKSGVAQGFLSLEMIKNLPLIKFNIEQQKKIAAILSAYDELIENNKRRIAILEKMAEEIYREWFVRFRFPGYQTAEFEKGIPKGWDIKTFRDITSYYVGGGWGEETESPTFTEGAYVIRGTDIPPLANGDYSNQVYRYHKPSNLKSRKLQKNDFIFEVSGGSKDQLLGRNLMVSEGLLSLFENKIICASFCKLIRFDAKQVSPFFMKYYLKLYYECDLVGIYQVQSTGISNYQFESFMNYQEIAIPATSLLDKFDEIAEPLIKQQESLATANMNLKKTRDLLLPRLISGKLSVENLDIKFPPSMCEEGEA